MSAKPLALPRHERYAQMLVAGAVASDAFREIYPRSQHWKPDAVWSNSAELTRKVRDRVEFLQAQGAAESRDTVGTLCAELDGACAEAVKNGQAGSIVAAVMGKAKLLGLLVDKRQDVTGRSLDEVSDDELLAIMRGKGGVN